MSLATGTMSTSETTNYRLRMYVDEDYNPQGDGGGLSFSVKINAYGKVKEAPTGSKMKAYRTQDTTGRPQTDFHTDAYSSKITSITTKKDNIVPATAKVRISQKVGHISDEINAKDGSVMAYGKMMEVVIVLIKLTIGGKGGIIANESMIGYFDGFNKMTSIDLSSLDTSQVTNMNGMFSRCMSLTSLDISNFDTSQVTNMSSMFIFCYGLTSLDVSNLDTSKVTDMSGMFFGCSSLISLDVSNSDTSNVTDMSGMFCDCPAWNTVDQTKFSGEHVGGSCIE